MPTIVETPGSATANSYLTVVEAQAYFDSRAAVPGWEDADSQEALLIMATRLIDHVLSGVRMYMPARGNMAAYFRVGPAWTGAATDGVQALAWPRTGMYNRNGYAIASTVIPQDLKNAVAELAGALGTKDLLLDNDIAVQGITGVKAGSVSVSFSDATMLTSKALPDSVLMMLVPSWYTDEGVESAGGRPEFEVL